MPSHYAQGLELLTRVQNQINDLKPDAMDRRTAVQRWHGLGQDWKLLRMAVIATGEVADDAVGVSNQQRTRYRTHIDRYFQSGELRISQADACLDQFRYVTALARHTRLVRQQHDFKLRSWGNLRAHYLEALGPQTPAVRLHQAFLDDLSRDMDAMKRNQSLEIVCLRWLRHRATADLADRASRFRRTCTRLDGRRSRADDAGGEAERLRATATRCVREYERLETGVLSVQGAIRALWDVLFGSGAEDAGESGSVPDGDADRMAVGV